MKALILIIVLAFSTTLFAQDSCSVENPHGLQFQIGDNFQLTSFNGYTFSYRFLLTENSGFRFGISYNLSDTEGTYEEISAYDTELKKDGTIESEGFGISISAQYHYVLVSKKNVNFFTGVGPFIRIAKSESISNEDELVTPFNTFSRRSSNEKYYGLTGIVGAEYMFSKDFSISAEIGLYFQYLTTESESVQKNKDEYTDYKKTTNSEHNGFQVIEIPVKMGLTLFF